MKDSGTATSRGLFILLDGSHHVGPRHWYYAARNTFRFRGWRGAQCVLTRAPVCQSIPMLLPAKLQALGASRAMAADHVVEASAAEADAMSVGSHAVRRNGTTEHKAMTLPEREVTAQGTGNRSC
jgi:hypothetical protein